MSKIVLIKNKIKNFKKKSIYVDGDKSLSIRFVLLSSLGKGKSIASNLLRSDDVNSAINSIRKLGIKIKIKNDICEVNGKGLFGFNYKKNLVLDLNNSGTSARLITSMLSNTNYWVKVTGDKSLKKRDMGRIIKPLRSFGIKFKNNRSKLPIWVKGSKLLKPIKYTESLGSAQCKSAVMIAALKANGKTKLRCLPSRNHTEIMFKNVLKIPIRLKKKNGFDVIEVEGMNEFNGFNYKIPGDISSASFFIVLTLLSKNNSLSIKNVNINPSRTGIIKILNMMGAQIKVFNKKSYKGELTADLFIQSNRKLKSIKLNPKFNSSAIDEFLLIFLVASVCKGISTFKNLSELNKKESKRLNWGIKILKMMNVKVKRLSDDGIKIWGDPNLELKKSFEIKKFLKDHRVFMVSTIAALTLGGQWKIYDGTCFKTSFPKYLKILNQLGAEIK